MIFSTLLKERKTHRFEKLLINRYMLSVKQNQCRHAIQNASGGPNQGISTTLRNKSINYLQA